MHAVDEWVRLFTDQENHCYKVFLRRSDGSAIRNGPT